MTLVKWTPKRSMFSIFDEVEQMMQQAFGNSIVNNVDMVPYSPPIDVREADAEYYVLMDLPGVEKKDVDVNLSNGVLTVSGERKKLDSGKDKNHIFHETSYGSFSRSFELTSDIVEGKIKAKFNNGVLNITIPKAEEIMPAVKKISVS